MRNGTLNNMKWITNLHPTLPLFSLLPTEHDHPRRAARSSHRAGLPLPSQDGSHNKEGVNEPEYLRVMVVVTGVRRFPNVAEVGNREYDGHLALRL